MQITFISKVTGVYKAICMIVKEWRQCLACVHPIRDARGWLGEHEGSVSCAGRACANT